MYVAFLSEGTVLSLYNHCSKLLWVRDAGVEVHSKSLSVGYLMCLHIRQLVRQWGHLWGSPEWLSNEGISTVDLNLWGSGFKVSFENLMRVKDLFFRKCTYAQIFHINSGGSWAPWSGFMDTRRILALSFKQRESSFEGNLEGKVNICSWGQRISHLGTLVSNSWSQTSNESSDLA